MVREMREVNVESRHESANATHQNDFWSGFGRVMAYAVVICELILHMAAFCSKLEDLRKGN